MTRALPIDVRARYAVELLESDSTESVASVADEFRISMSTVLHHWHKTHVESPRGRRWQATAILCSVVLDHVTRFEQTFGEIWDAVRQDYGEIGERRMHRALRQLVDAGLVTRHPRPSLPATYTRAEERISGAVTPDTEELCL